MILSEEQYDAAYLKHYGVLGMHWGVRKDDSNRVVSRGKSLATIAAGGIIANRTLSLIMRKTGALGLGALGQGASLGIGALATAAVIGRDGGKHMPTRAAKPGEINQRQNFERDLNREIRQNPMYGERNSRS